MQVISLTGLARAEHGVDAQRIVVETAAGDISLGVYDSFQSVERAWRTLESRGICVNAQTFDRARLWFESVSAPDGARPVLAVGMSRDNEPQFLWPLEAIQVRGVVCLKWIGWQHANYQMGLHTLQFARAVTEADMKALLQGVADRSRANAALLKFQPLEWDGARNPVCLLPSRPSTSIGHSVLLDRDFDNLYRNKFSGKSRNTTRRKEKRLAAEGSVDIGWAKTAEERRGLLDEFFRQKRKQFAEQGIADAFSDPKVRDFYHDLARLPSGEDGTLEIAFLKFNEKPIALSCGIRFRDKFETLLTSIDAGRLGRYSPGALLAKFQIEQCCAWGLNFYDMGAGEAPHKADWCDVATPLFDSAIAFDERGYLLTLPHIAATAGKRAIKNNPILWRMARGVRNTLFGHGAHNEPPVRAH